MPNFILKYPGEEVKSEDFSIIGRTIKDRGHPLAVRYEWNESLFYEVNLVNGRFCLHGLWICPIHGQKVLSDLKVQYRPIWGINWLRAFKIATGASNSKKIYNLGWQITLDGKNYQKILRLFDNGEIGFG